MVETNSLLGRKIITRQHFPWGDFVKKKYAVIFLTLFVSATSLSGLWLYQTRRSLVQTPSVDDALLALIKNDLASFDRFLDAGGDVHSLLPTIDGKTYTVAQGVSYFERIDFARSLVGRGSAFIKQDPLGTQDIMTLAVKNNNADYLRVLLKAKPNLNMAYGKNGWTLLHMASAWCSDRLVGELTKNGKIGWNHRAQDGATPLTLAAEKECLPLLSYWKEQGADFRDRDGRGRTALNILKSKKGAALAAFAQSFEERKVSSITVVKTEAAVPDFYKKRKIPNEQVVDHAAMLEPEDRPLEATETAEYSEFSD